MAPARSIRQGGGSGGEQGDPILALEGVAFSYPDAKTPVCTDVSLQLAKGELLGLAGTSGSGKTTLIRLINGLAPHHFGGSYEGEMRLFTGGGGQRNEKKKTTKRGGEGSAEGSRALPSSLGPCIPPPLQSCTSNGPHGDGTGDGGPGCRGERCGGGVSRARGGSGGGCPLS